MSPHISAADIPQKQLKTTKADKDVQGKISNLFLVLMLPYSTSVKPMWRPQK